MSARNDLATQDEEIGNPTMGSFLKETRGALTFWDGIEWRGFKSKAHLAQLEQALTVYLDKQLEHIEYTLALTMSKRRGELFEVYQRAVTEISDRIRDQTIEDRTKSTKKVMTALQQFLADKNEFDLDIAQSDLPETDQARLTALNEDITDDNVKALFGELKTELTHYNEMCQRIFVGMNDEIERHRETISSS